MKITSDYDKNADFSKYRTFAWIAPYDTVLHTHIKNRPYANYIIKKCDEELVKKGMALDSVHPDVVLMYDAHLLESTEYKQTPVTSVGVAVYAPMYYGQGYYGGGTVFDPNGYNMGSQYPLNSSAYYGGYYYAAASAPVAGGKVTAHHVEEGELFINMYDAKSRKYIWGGMADEKDMTISTDIPTVINEAVSKIFKTLPIKK